MDFVNMVDILDLVDIVSVDKEPMVDMADMMDNVKLECNNNISAKLCRVVLSAPSICLPLSQTPP